MSTAQAAAGTEEDTPRPFQMGTVGKHALVYGLGTFLSRAVGFIMLPVYTRYLSPADYGLMELIGMTLEVISIMAGAQVALGIFRYYHKAETPDEQRAVVSTALFALGASYVMVGIVGMLAAPFLSSLLFGSAQHADLFRIASAGLAFQSLITVPMAFARVRDRSLLFVSVNAVKLAISLVLNIVLLTQLGMGVKGVLISNLVANAVVGLWLTVSVIREVGARFSRSATRDLLRYGVPMMGTWAAAFLLTYGDRYFLQAAGDATTVGLYSLAYQFGFLLSAVGYIPFMQVWEPKRFEVAKRPDRDAVMARAFVYMNVLLLTCAVGISLFVGDLLRIMATPAFGAAAEIVPVVLAAYVLQGWTSLQDTGILVRERTELVTLANWIAAGVALGGYALLIPSMLAWGAALATLAAFAVRHAIVYTISQRLWPVRYQWAPVLRLAAAAVVVCAAGVWMAPGGLWASAGVHALLLAVYFAALWNMDVLTADDRAIVRRFASRLALTVASSLRNLRVRYA